MSDQKEQLNRRILAAKERLAAAEIKIDTVKADRELITRILSGSENRAYQGGSGGRGLMAIDVPTAVACGELGIEMKLNVNFTKASVDILTRRNYSKERDVLDCEREVRDAREEITRAQTELRIIDMYQPAPVALPQVVLPQVTAPQWLVLNATGDGTDPYTGQDLNHDALVTSDRGASWVTAVEAGLAEAPVKLPKPKK